MFLSFKIEKNERIFQENGFQERCCILCCEIHFAGGGEQYQIMHAEDADGAGEARESLLT
jgi:hypothetical protein